MHSVMSGMGGPQTLDEHHDAGDDDEGSPIIMNVDEGRPEIARDSTFGTTNYTIAPTLSFWLWEIEHVAYNH
jgi:hypothetical protein